MPQITISEQDIQAVKDFIPAFQKEMVNVYPLIPAPYNFIAPLVVALVSRAVLQVIDNLPPDTEGTEDQQSTTSKQGKDIINKKSNPEAYNKAG